MLYSIICKDRIEEGQSNSIASRKPHSIEHMTKLKQLKDEGRLIIAGPLSKADSMDTSIQGVAGSLIIAEFLSLEDAKTWIHDDPFYISGVYESVEVFPFKQVLS